MNEEPTIHLTVGFGPEGRDETRSESRQLIAECRELQKVRVVLHPDESEDELCYICVERKRLLDELDPEEPETDLTVSELEEMFGVAIPVKIVTNPINAPASIYLAREAVLRSAAAWVAARKTHIVADILAANEGLIEAVATYQALLENKS